MSEVFGSKSFFKLLGEVVLVALGVFLALLADQWREDRQHRQNAQEILRYFREEVAANQKAVQAVRSYHQKLLEDLQRFEGSDVPRTFEDLTSKIQYTGLRPVNFERTAMDVALANQSLSYLNPQLAYAIARVYTRQQAFQSVQNSFLQGAYSPSTFAAPDARGLITAMQAYLTDVNIQEPQILQLYGELLPQIDATGAPSKAANR